MFWSRLVYVVIKSLNVVIIVWNFWISVFRTISFQTPHAVLTRMWALSRIVLWAGRVDSFAVWVILLCRVIFNDILKLCEKSYYHKKQKNAFKLSSSVWIRLITTEAAYLLHAQELWQNNALLLQFWCMSNTLILFVHALDASKSQRTCIILSQFTCKSKYFIINL